MGLSVCPVTAVEAPVEVVLETLVQWEHYSEWADVHPERIEPEGPATVGQTISFAGKALGHTWRFSFKIEEINKERHVFGLHAFFHLDCNGYHASPVLLSMRPLAGSNMVETSSSHQAGGVGFSKYLALKPSLPA